MVSLSLAALLAVLGLLAGLVSILFVRPRVLAALERRLPEASDADRLAKATALRWIGRIMLLDPLVFCGLGFLAGSLLGG